VVSLSRRPSKADGASHAAGETEGPINPVSISWQASRKWTDVGGRTCDDGEGRSVKNLKSRNSDQVYNSIILKLYHAVI
jgi:hypothetical protein